MQKLWQGLLHNRDRSGRKRTVFGQVAQMSQKQRRREMKWVFAFIVMIWLNAPWYMYLLYAGCCSSDLLIKCLIIRNLIDTVGGE